MNEINELKEKLATAMNAIRQSNKFLVALKFDVTNLNQEAMTPRIQKLIELNNAATIRAATFNVKT